MKIIYLHQYFNTPTMSGGTRSYVMAKKLVESGYDVHIITSWREATTKTSWFQTKEDGIHVHWYPVEYSNQLSFKTRIARFLLFSWHAIQKSIELKADIVFATSTPLTIAIPAILASKIKRKPLIFEVRDLWPDIPIKIGAIKNPIVIYLSKTLEKVAYRTSSAIIALSPEMKQGIVDKGVESKKVAVIPNFCDNTLFSNQPDNDEFFIKRPWAKQSKLILYSGALGWANDVDRLVDIAAKLIKYATPIKFLIIGDGARYKTIKDKAIKLEVLGNNLFLEPSVSKQDIADIYSYADLVTCLFSDPYIYSSNSPNKFFDGLAAGKPVLINMSGWLYQIVKETQCGLNILDISDDEVADILNKVLNDEETIRRFSSNAKKLALTQFNGDRLSEQFVQVFKKVEGFDNNISKITEDYYD